MNRALRRSPFCAANPAASTIKRAVEFLSATLPANLTLAQKVGLAGTLEPAKLSCTLCTYNLPTHQALLIRLTFAANGSILYSNFS